MNKYEVHVSLKPEYHGGQMKHYWHISQTNADGTFTVAHGYAGEFYEAIDEAEEKAYQLGLV